MQIIPRPRPLALLAALAASATGLFVFTTWTLGQWRSATFGAEYIPMAPLTALLFALLGSALAARVRWPESNRARWAGVIASCLTLTVAGVEAGRAWLTVTLPWDDWLLSAPTRVGSISIGRMAPVSAFTFLLTALALLGQSLPYAGRTAFRRFTYVTAGAGLAVGGIMTGAYATGTPLLYDGTALPMALLTALAFIALNGGLLLVGQVEKLLRELHAQENAPFLPPENRVFTRRLILSLCLVSGLICAGAIFYLSREERDTRAVIYAQLEAIANLKVEQVVAWRTERLGEARFLMRTPAVVRDVAAFAARPGAAEADQLRDWLEPIKDGDRYSSIRVLDPQQRLLLAVPAAAGSDHPVPPGLFARALAGSGPEFGELHQAGPDAAVDLDLLVPIRPLPADTSRGNSAPIAIIVLQMNPARFLFPLIEHWPVPSATAESVLVRREGDEVVYLNKLRQLPDPPLTLRRSVGEAHLVEAMAARGLLGVQEGVDYRGVPELCVIRRIPDSSWILLAEIAQAEAYAPIRLDALQTGLAVILLLAAVAMLGTSLWRARHADSLRRALVAEQERQAVADRLSLVTQYASDIILLLDEHGSILEANERALTTYGYTLAELRALPPGGLRAPSTKVDLPAQLARLYTPEGTLFETVHQRKDGSQFPVEGSGRTVSLGGRRHLLGIFRDITERKRLGEELSWQEAQFRAIFDHAPVGMSLTSGGKLRLVNAEHVRITGVPIEQSAEPGIFGRVSHPEDYARQAALAEKFIRGEIDHYTVEKRYLHPDGHVQWAELSSRFFRGPDMGADWIVTTVTDIQQRKAHEREIERLNRIYFVISQVNQTIVRAKLRAELFPEICRVLVEYGRFKIAWIGWLNPGTRHIDPVAVAGDEHGYVSGIKICCDGDVPEGRGPSGTAFREGRINVCNDFFGDPALRPWHERARASGFQSSIALPLREGGVVQGLLTAYAPEKNFFGPQEISLLEEAASDLSFSLDVIAGNERRMAAEAALQRSKEDFSRVFMSSPSAVSITTFAEGRYLDLNDAWERLSGYRRDEVIGRTTVDLQVWSGAGDREEIRRLMATEHRVSVRETRFRRKDGTTLDTLLSIEGINFGGELCLIATIIDITGQKQAQRKLTEQIEELRRWHEATLGREGRILDLKREVNELLDRAGAPPRYPSATPPEGPRDV